MRKTLLMSAALLALAYGPVLAQNSMSSTQSPPSPNSGQGMPQPSNSLPDTAGTASRNLPGDTLGTAGTPRGRPMSSSSDMMGGHRRMRHRRVTTSDAGMSGEAAVDAPPSDAYRGGAGSPRSNHASNIAASETRSEIAPRLPDPATASNTPEAYLAAAQSALSSGKTGAAQEALERAETRLLSRSTDPSAAASPADMPMVQQIGQARQALAPRHSAGAGAPIRAAWANGGYARRGPAHGAGPVPCRMAMAAARSWRRRGIFASQNCECLPMCAMQHAGVSQASAPSLFAATPGAKVFHGHSQHRHHRPR